MTLGLDIDDTITRHPAFFAFLATSLIAAGHRVVILTMRVDRVRASADLARMGVPWSELHCCPDDPPYPDCWSWKGELCRKLGVDLFFDGPAGVGKTGLATGLLYKALINGYRGRFVRAQDLFDEINASLLDRSSRRILNELCGYAVLCIDELGYLNLKPDQTNIFFKLMEERYTAKKPTIITTNLDYEQWYEFLGQKPMVQALLDRVRHHCHTIRIAGATLRCPTG